MADRAVSVSMSVKESERVCGNVRKPIQLIYIKEIE
jgi:hypothetical protein